MRHRWLMVGAVALSFALAAAGVRFAAAPAFIGTPDAVHIVVTEVQPLTQSTTVIFDRQLSHQAPALYEQVVSGEPLTAGGGCPASSGQQPYYHYVLTFSHLGVRVATATSDARGCMNIAVAYPDGSIARYSWLNNQHVSFWVRLHQLVNAPEPIGICATIPLCYS